MRSEDIGVDDADCCHQREHRRGAHETKPSALEVGGECHRLRQLRGNLVLRARVWIVGRAIRPDQFAEMGRAVRRVGIVSDGNRGVRVSDRRLDLAAVTYDPGCAHETIDVVGREGGDAVGNKGL